MSHTLVRLLFIPIINRPIPTPDLQQHHLSSSLLTLTEGNTTNLTPRARRLSQHSLTWRWMSSTHWNTPRLYDVCNTAIGMRKPVIAQDILSLIAAVHV